MRCKHGHDLQPKDIYVNPSGKKVCRECKKINTIRSRIKRRNAKKKAEIEVDPDWGPMPI